MADWRQIQARIRKAKAGTDPHAQLAELYERTRDAMVAFELARLYEKAGENGEAARWYTTASERFRRAQWKTKAAEALVRLGAPAPAAKAAGAVALASAPSTEFAPPASSGFGAEETVAPAEPGPEFFEATAGQAARPLEPPAEKPTAAEAPAEQRRGRRGGRGRRGRRGRRRGPATKVSFAAEAPQGEAARPHPMAHWPAEPARREEPAELPTESVRAPEPAAGPAGWQVRGRAGEPALASRLAHLESQLRRLLAGPLSRPDEADQAPAGPGVFILSDADQTTYYYVEACQTLRIGVGNLLRGERGGSARRGVSLRARFAEHLSISESRVSKYLKDHCAVRWLQLDEGAPQVAHFAIAVLRPALND